AAAQSAVYRTTLAAALICPLATWLLASAGVSGLWSIDMPAAWRYEQVAVAAPAPEATPAPVEVAAVEPNEPEPLSLAPQGQAGGFAVAPQRDSFDRSDGPQAF